MYWKTVLYILLLTAPGFTQASSIADEIVEATNAVRLRAGLPNLVPHISLIKAADSHSDEMIRLNYFSHTSPTAGRQKIADRVKAAGITPQSVAENLYSADGYPESSVARETIKAWLESPAHKANILNPKYTHIGVGVAKKGPVYRITQVLAGGDLNFEAAVSPAGRPTSATSNSSVAQKLLEETNVRRRDAGLQPLQADPYLQTAAQGHSKEMLQLGYFAHESPTRTRKRVRERVRLAGADPIYLAENIYFCEGYAENTVALRAILSFMQSDGHRENILNPSYERIGIGVYEANGKFYVTQVFGGD